MTSPSLELQGLIVNALKADTRVMALVDGVYDQPPDTRWSGALQAYISLGPTDVLIDDADCVAGEEHTIQIDVWSRTVGSVQCKKICDAVKRALHDNDALALVDNALVEMLLKLFKVMRDPDGLTTHGVMQFTAMIEEGE